MSENRNSKNREGASDSEDLGFLSKSPRTTIVIMFILLLLGLVLIFVNRSKNREDPGMEAITIDQILDVTDSIEINYGFGDLIEVLSLEKQLKEVMSKDSLTSKDSLFIKSLDQKLNKMIDEKN